MIDAQDHADQRIAIVGMAGRFPGARNVDELWRNLRDGRESITTFTDAELEAAGVASEDRNAEDYVRAGAVLEDAEWFDSSLFGYSPREADLLDPQHRLVLECAWEALENAACDPNRCRARIGLIVGSASNSSFLAHLVRHPELVRTVGEYQVLLGNERDFLATRVSYKLNLTGPSFTIQSACSTSLVAVHLACQSLLSGECDMALAGGVCVSFPQTAGYHYDPNGVASPDGHCRPFDAAARGSVLGRGVGIVALKRYRDAVADRDNVRAVILASAVNNDGRTKIGFTAPSVQGQADVIAEAVSLAGIPAETIGYVEAHGTGTALGDPIEVAALADAFRRSGRSRGSCALGSVKSNIGHLDAAAGVAGLIKTVLVLQHGEIPPTVHFQSPNPKIAFDDSPFFVNAELRPWPRGAAPRRAGVSSFGIGGTNAHIVMEEAPEQEASRGARAWHLLVVSAQSEPARREAVRQVQEAVLTGSGEALADAAYTLQVGRQEFRHRWAQVVSSAGEPSRPAVWSRAGEKAAEAVMWFGPEAWSAAERGTGLYAGEPPFQEAMDECRSALGAIGCGQSNAGERLAVQYALGRLWRRWGLKDAEGEGTGAWIAAAVSGRLALEDALRKALAEAEPGPAGTRRADRVYLEMRPGEADVLCTLPADGTSDEQAHALAVLGTLWSLGAAVSWDGFYEGQRRRRLALPAYPFQRRRHWLDAPAADPTVSRRTIDEWFYIPSWRRSAPARQLGTLASASRRWLIFGDEQGLGSSLAEAIERAGRQVALVSRGGSFERRSARHYVIRPGAAGDYDALLADLRLDGLPEIILHLWNVTPERDVPEDAHEETAFFGPLSLIQALGRRGDTGAVSLVMAANHLHRVTGDEQLMPAKALLRGLCQVVPQEFPRIRCRSVDVQVPPAGSPERTRLIAQLIDEAEHGCGPESVAYREAARFVETVEPLPLPANEGAASVLRERGVYLITGGLGGIGRTLASFLAETWHARLVLTHLHPRTGAAESEIHELTSSLDGLGAETLVLQADAADSHAMQRVRQQVEQRFGRVHGIVHASGISPGGLIQGKTREKARAVFLPKMDGLRVLEAVFPPAELDFLFLCSSLTSFTHIVGQADYTAANAYLDAYAQAARTTRVISVNWDTWVQAGMAIRARSVVHAGADAAAQDGISSREGVEVFRRAIQAGLPQLGVSTKDLPAQIRLSRRFDQSQLLAIARGIDVARPRRTRAGSRAAAQPPKIEIERRVARIWEEALGIDQIGSAEDFFELGGNSLLGIQILARLREAFPVELPLSAIFETPTVASMAASLAVELAKTLERSAGSAG